LGVLRKHLISVVNAMRLTPSCPRFPSSCPSNRHPVPTVARGGRDGRLDATARQGLLEPPRLRRLGPGGCESMASACLRWSLRFGGCAGFPMLPNAPWDVSFGGTPYAPSAESIFLDICCAAS
jgi:hypothetical protein